MSILLDRFDVTDEFVSEENFSVIRNDLRYFLKPIAVERSEDLEDYSEENFRDHLESIRGCIEKGEEISTKFDNW